MLVRAALICALCFSLALASSCSYIRSSPADPRRYREWTTVGGAENIHYSSLDQINRTNVGSLQPVWTFDTEDGFPISEMPCNPIVIEGVLYATTPKLKVIALDAASGKLIWRFDPNEGKGSPGKMRNRGVTYWASGADRRIFFTFRNFLYALDAATGNPVPQFGGEGRIDLNLGLDREAKNFSVTVTSPPAVFKDLLIVGSLMPEALPSGPGHIRAFDARTGERRWIFHTIPHPGELGYKTWPPDAWQYSGGANNWCGMTVDAARGLVFVPTGSAAFDFYGANRIGDNLFANTLLCLDAETGKRKWHFQTVKHDLWDRDLPAAPSLVTVRRGWRAIDAVAQPTKSGFIFLFNRRNGKPLYPIEERSVSRDVAPGELAAPTQPLPKIPPPFARQWLTEEMLTKRTPEAHAAALEMFRKIRSKGQFEPPSLEGTIVFPGFDGGAEWGGTAFDPDTNLLYVNANEMAWILRLVKKPQLPVKATGEQIYGALCASCHKVDLRGTPPEFPSLEGILKRRTEADVRAQITNGQGRMPGYSGLDDNAMNAVVRYVCAGENIETTTTLSGVSPLDLMYTFDGYNKFLDPDGYPAVEPPWGTLTAIDLNKGTFAWRIPLGEYPELAAKGMKNTGSENYGGPLVTAGGLLFIGATDFDKKFRAFDKRTGELLWETLLPAAGNATPCTYEVNGRQYVVIAAGGGKWGAPSGGSYVAFALPR
ncbi:pyrroloquinoline quinone-dependent dehydrogenase [Candidatus Sumerlaeota bacterium]|nr:pyrroloquinoline quinone-dependent dehydrogenase [Candidatus Sumerlaeota bacterium]